MADKREKPPRCPRCHVGGYTITNATDGRPRFDCMRCGHWWTNGLDGGEYMTRRDSTSNTGGGE